MYSFKGVFTRQTCDSLRLDTGKYTLRDLRPSYPFSGVLIHPRLREAAEDGIVLEDAVSELIKGGLISGLAISYATFGGPVEHLAGFEIEGSAIVAESRFESNFDFSDDEFRDDELSTLFIAKMSAYGIPPEENGFFFPFTSGFWR